MSNYRFTFCASTGRTATMFLAATLNTLSRVVGLHEGHTPGDPPIPWLPLINLQNRKAWFDPAYAERTVAEIRDFAALSREAGDADVLVDVAFYNAPLLVPLAIPLIAGPSMLAVLLLFATADPEKLVQLLLAASLAWTITFLVLFTSTFLVKYLKKRGLIAIKRLMGMVLITLSVQLFLDGITNYTK